jgi:hypothetical protein
MYECIYKKTRLLNAMYENMSNDKSGIHDMQTHV